MAKGKELTIDPENINLMFHFFYEQARAVKERHIGPRPGMGDYWDLPSPPCKHCEHQDMGMRDTAIYMIEQILHRRLIESDYDIWDKEGHRRGLMEIAICHARKRGLDTAITRKRVGEFLDRPLLDDGIGWGNGKIWYLMRDFVRVVHSSPKLRKLEALLPKNQIVTNEIVCAHCKKLRPE